MRRQGPTKRDDLPKKRRPLEKMAAFRVGRPHPGLRRLLWLKKTSFEGSGVTKVLMAASHLLVEYARTIVITGKAIFV